MQKKYRMEVTEMERKTEEQIKAERERRNDYNYSKLHAATYDEAEWNTQRVILVDLSEDEMQRVKLAVIKEI